MTDPKWSAEIDKVAMDGLDASNDERVVTVENVLELLKRVEAEAREAVLEEARDATHRVCRRFRKYGNKAAELSVASVFAELDALKKGTADE